MRVGDMAAGRAGDKGDMLDLTLVAKDAAAYALLERAGRRGGARPAQPGAARPGAAHEVPGLNALKFVFPQALPGGVYASLRPGLHWQKAAIWLLLDLDIDSASLQLRWGAGQRAA
ncbi:hypothetical protein LP417_23155 [Polaromonas sp. P1-6]|nr:hypothetical protein LP417_23155 [Polaromonas sp. P1-6]